MKTLHSNRLTLRPVEPADIHELARMLGDREIMEFLFSGKPMTTMEAEEFIKTHFSFDERDPFGMGTLVEKATNMIVGFAGLIKSVLAYEADLELGFALNASGRRKGYAIEIGMRQIVFGFSASNCPRLLALVHPDNRKSIHRLRDNLGMRMGEQIATDRGPRLVFSIERDSYLARTAYYHSCIDSQDIV